MVALHSLGRNRLQTVLTALAMIIGVGTVLVMIVVGSGAQDSIRSQVCAAGMNVVVVTSGNYRMAQKWTSQGEAEETAAWHPHQHQPFFRRTVYVHDSRTLWRTVQKHSGDWEMMESTP